MNNSQVHDAVRDSCAALDIEVYRYQVRLVVTTRAIHDLEVDAVDDDHAFNLVQQIRARDYSWAYEEGIEGDEIAYITNRDDGELDCGADIEVDLRSKGEPYSWVACDIVKALAVATTDEERQMLIVQAREACTTARDREEPINNG